MHVNTPTQVKDKGENFVCKTEKGGVPGHNSPHNANTVPACIIHPV